VQVYACLRALAAGTTKHGPSANADGPCRVEIIRPCFWPNEFGPTTPTCSLNPWKGHYGSPPTMTVTILSG